MILVSRQDQPRSTGFAPAMSDHAPLLPGLLPVAGKPVHVAFDGGRLTSDAGVLMLAEIERRLGIAERLARCIEDPRSPERVYHTLAEMMRFRMLLIAAGYPDANDCDALRADPAFKMALGRAPESGADLCSQPTMSRLENRNRCVAPTFLGGQRHVRVERSGKERLDTCRTLSFCPYRSRRVGSRSSPVPDGGAPGRPRPRPGSSPRARRPAPRSARWRAGTA